mmetsp:Transcript_46659/g.87220  ORF Transcript_46659/g.87220 Transcript_46659/m.87220 type:complete len:112 (-) Transcript_46659:709-1044(-)
MRQASALRPWQRPYVLATAAFGTAGGTSLAQLRSWALKSEWQRVVAALAADMARGEKQRSVQAKTSRLLAALSGSWREAVALYGGRSSLLASLQVYQPLGFNGAQVFTPLS